MVNALASAPPLIGVSINDRGDDPKDTLRNIRETGEFVCNYDVSMEEQGRIFAMSVKQAITGRIREKIGA